MIKIFIGISNDEGPTLILHLYVQLKYFNIDIARRRADPVETTYSIRLCFNGFERSDWLKIFKGPIKML